MKKKILIIILVILFIALLGTGIFFLVKHNKKENKSNEIIGISNNPNIILDDERVPIFVDGKNVETIVSSKNDVYAVLDELGEMYGFESSKDVFNIVSEDKSSDFTYYKVNQKYNDIEIYGKQLIVTVKDKEVINVVGHYYKDLKIEGEYKKSENDVKQIIDKIEKEQVDEIDYKVQSLDKKIYIDADDKPYLVYVVKVYDSFGSVVYFISGVDGTVINSLRNNQGEKYVYTGVGIDEKEHTINLDKNLLGYRFMDPDRNIVIEDGVGIGTVFCKNGSKKWLNAIAYVIKTNSHNPITTSLYDGELIYGDIPEATKDYVKGAISTMANFETVYDYYKNLGRKSFDNKGSEIYILLGAGNELWEYEDLDNAYWGGEFFVIGNHNGKPISMALDVVAHEYTHAVIQYTAGLEYNGESGALNEGYADIMGNLIEGKNFEVGEGADFLIRDMADPNKFNQPKEKGGEYYFPTDTNYYDAERQEKIKQKCIERCIDLEDWTKYDNGGVHINSGVPNHAAYLMYENGAFSSKDEMAKVWYNSLFMLTSTATFEDTALAILV